MTNQCSLFVRVTPRSHKNIFVSIEGNVCKIRLKSPPHEGAANASLIEFLSSLLKIPKTQIVLHKGSKTRLKEMHIQGLALPEVLERLKEQPLD